MAVVGDVLAHVANGVIMPNMSSKKRMIHFIVKISL